MKTKLLLLLLVALTATAALAQNTTTKLRVTNPQRAQQLVAHGAKVIADYGSFQLLEAPAAMGKETAGQADVASADEMNTVHLNAAPLDTTSPAVKALRTARAPFAGKRLHLVQFAGPIKPEWRDELEKRGARIVSHIPNNAYLIYGDSAALTEIQSWAKSAAYVQWEATFADSYKIHPRAKNTDANGQFRDIGTETFAIQLVEDDDANAATLAVIGQYQLAPVKNDYKLLGYRTVIVELPASQFDTIATQPDVVSIQPYFKHRKFDERQDQIIAGNLTGNSPTGPGYLAWLAGKGFTQAQFDSSGFIVDVSDSGIDNGTTSPGHFALYKQGNPGGSSRVAYNRLVGTANSGSTLSGCDGHGNLNSHIIGGYSDMPTGGIHADTSNFRYGLGVAPFVKLGSSVIFDPDTFTDPNYANLQSQAYNDGARVSANSWGGDTAGAYDTDAQAYDALVRDAQPTGSTFATAGNQQMVIVFAAGNAGPATQTVGSPGTAKNIITVGAAENVRAFGGSDDSGVSDTGANSANDIIDFSSRGPCADGRYKPDIAAPGTHITGGVGQSGSPTTNGTGSALSCFNGEGVSGGTGGSHYFPSSGQQFYTASSGTSHSTPGIAGACALLRQYFINASLTPPSPAMTKAFLVNSARYMTGTYANDTLPSQSQGLGHVNLGMAFDGVPRVLRDQASADKFTASGQTRTVSGTVMDNTRPFRVTLAWTDAPGSTTGAAYNNNLDLTVTVGGNTYIGNVFSGSNSITGGTADVKNNVESVFLPAGVSGPFTVTVTAANINSDGVPNEAPATDQDFALVIYNATETDAPVITAPPQNTSVLPGTLANFSVTAVSVAPLSYQWYFNSNILSGATATNYFIPSVDATNLGAYYVVVTNVNGSATSSVATLTFATAPVITTNPASQTVVAGGTANFSVTTTGSTPLAYQWQFNNTNIPSATASNYSLAGVTTNNAGDYMVIITNVAGAVTSTPATLTVTSLPPAVVVISQVYGGGGNTGATYQNDYVELFNRGSSPVSLTGWSVQYASSSGTTWTPVALQGTIQSNSYYLVALASGGSAGAALPITQVTNSSLNLSATSGKVALVSVTTALAGANPVGTNIIVDFVGYGSANAFEGSAAAPGGGNALAIFRAANGATDTDDNAADFATSTPNPRTNAVAPATPLVDLAITMSHTGSFTQGDSNRIYTIVVTNLGTVAATGSVSVVDTLPAGLIATAMSGAGWATNLGTLTATRADALGAGASYPAITVTVSVATNAVNRVTNSVVVSGGGDTNTLNNTAIDPTIITSPGGGGGSTNTYTGVLVGWDMSGLTAFGSSPLAPTTNAPLLVVVAGLTRGSGVTTTPTAAGRAWGGNGFDSSTSAAAITAGDYATLTVTATNGYKLSFTNISRFDYRRSGSGAPNGLLQFQVGTGAFTDIATVSYSSSGNSGASLSPIDLSSISALQGVGAGTNVTFRLVNYGGTGGNWYIYDVANSAALDFTIQGGIAPLAPPAPPAVAPVIGGAAYTNGQFQFQLTGTSGSNYVVLTSTNLAGTNWISIWTNPAPFTFVETNATNFPLRFYRGRVQP